MQPASPSLAWCRQCLQLREHGIYGVSAATSHGILSDAAIHQIIARIELFRSAAGTAAHTNCRRAESPRLLWPGVSGGRSERKRPCLPNCAKERRRTVRSILRVSIAALRPSSRRPPAADGSHSRSSHPVRDRNTADGRSTADRAPGCRGDARHDDDRRGADARQRRDRDRPGAATSAARAQPRQSGSSTTPVTRSPPSLPARSG